MSFKYIKSDNVGYTAGDADTLTNLGFGELLPETEEVKEFLIGNTGSESADFTVSGYTTNGDILGDFLISFGDQNDYGPIDSGISIPDLGPNEISAPVFIKFTPKSANVLISLGSVLIITTES